MTMLAEIKNAEPVPRTREAAGRYHRAQPGSPAEDQLVRQHLSLVKTVVGRIAMTLPAHVESEELYSAGLVGLLQAVRHFDPGAGSSFESYARVRIRGAIFDELRRLDWVPRSVHEKARKVQAAIQQLEQAKGGMPTDDEIARSLNISADEYEQLLNQIRPITFVCLDSVRSAEEEGECARYESIPDASQEDPVEAASRRELSRIVAERLDQMPETQRKVLALYYFEDLRLREIAELLGVTESRVCQIHAQAILNIKSYLSRQEQTAMLRV